MSESNLASKSVEERCQLVHDVRIVYPRRRVITDLMTQCVTESRGRAEPKSLFIGGDTGVGKSSLIQSFMSNYPRQSTPDGDLVPVLCTPIPAVATIKGTASMMLAQLRDLNPDKGTLEHMTRKVRVQLKECETRMLIFDEFQHLIDRDSDRVISKTVDWMKQLLDLTGLPIVLVGIRHSEEILRDNGQLARRFPQRVILEPFNAASEEGRAEFATFLDLLDKALPFDERSNLAAKAVATRLFQASKGRMAYLMLLVREAAETAIKAGAPCIRPGHLDEAYRKFQLDLEAPETSSRRRRAVPQRKESLAQALAA